MTGLRTGVSVIGQIALGIVCYEEGSIDYIGGVWACKGKHNVKSPIISILRLKFED